MNMYPDYKTDYYPNTMICIVMIRRYNYITYYNVSSHKYLPINVLFYPVLGNVSVFLDRLTTDTHHPFSSARLENVLIFFKSWLPLHRPPPTCLCPSVLFARDRDLHGQNRVSGVN